MAGLHARLPCWPHCKGSGISSGAHGGGSECMSVSSVRVSVCIYLILIVCACVYMCAHMCVQCVFSLCCPCDFLVEDCFGWKQHEEFLMITGALKWASEYTERILMGNPTGRNIFQGVLSTFSTHPVVWMPRRRMCVCGLRHEDVCVWS